MKDFDQWYEALEQGRKDVLLDDKWMLARAAYKAGIEAAMGSKKPGHKVSEPPKVDPHEFIGIC